MDGRNTHGFRNNIHPNKQSPTRYKTLSPHSQMQDRPTHKVLLVRPALGSFFCVFKVDSQAPRRAVQCLLAYKLIHHSGWSARPTR